MQALRHMAAMGVLLTPFIMDGQWPLYRSIQTLDGTRDMVSVSFNARITSLSRPVTGAPCSFDQIRVRTQTLHDGSHITESFPSWFENRDGKGRRRIEHTYMPGPDGKPGLNVIEIRDFVGGYEYTLDPSAKVAHRIKIPEKFTPNRLVVLGEEPALTTTKPIDGIQIRRENLRERNIEGVMAQGIRTTTTIPIGLEGNDAPIVRTDEVWYSPELKLTLQFSSNDPRRGETIDKMVNIKRGEPDPALFQIPSDFSIVDESDKFTSSVTRRR